MPTATEVKVPDIGDFTDVPVIELHVAPGDLVNEEDPLITLESDKATMDIPSPAAGTVRELRVSVGDRVTQGAPILTIEREAAETTPPSLVDQQEPPTEEAADPAAAAREPARRSAERAAASTPAASTPAASTPAASTPAASTPAASTPAASTPAAPAADFTGVHAGPSVRRLARELSVDLATITGSGEKGRITKADLLAGVRGSGPAPAAVAGQPAAAGIPEIPAQDFGKFGPVETRPLSRIQRLSGPHLHRSWLNIPHVTQHDEADITELDAYRRELDTAARAEGYRVTLLAFLMKASVSALREYPKVNSSLTPEKDALVYKRYYHIGIAVDTREGLVVPVIRDVDRKGIRELSRELGEVSARARGGTLSATDMSGGSFTISSLGGIGGTGFTPVVNAPEVAILGVVRAKTAPVWNGRKFKPRRMLPVSLSYDHRVVDGALAARFVRHLCHLLEDVRRLVL